MMEERELRKVLPRFRWHILWRNPSRRDLRCIVRILTLWGRRFVRFNAHPAKDAFGAPSAQVKVVYRTNSTVGKVKLGKLYDRNQTQAQPHVSFMGPAIEKSNFYSLVTVDPDARSPTNFTFRNILHWLVVNIPGDLKHSQDIATVGTVVSPYVGPAPPLGTHRYIFLLFSQGSRMISPPAYPRPSFSVRNFTDTYDLGWPLGGTLFRASFDDQ